MMFPLEVILRWEGSQVLITQLLFPLYTESLFRGQSNRHTQKVPKRLWS